MEGLYLYCLREKTQSPSPPPPISVKGIDGKGEVFILPFHGLEAVISKVSLEEFGSGDEIQKKAREDLNWIKEKAIAHEEVVEEVMSWNDNSSGLIPMRFGIIFKQETGLQETLNKDYSRIKETLEKVRGKEEWGVKVYLKDRKGFEQEIKERSSLIKEKEKEIAALPEGMAFFMEEELKEIVSEEMGKELNKYIEVFFESLRKHAAGSIKNKVLEKELTGRCEPMILNAAYLIPVEEKEDFKREAEGLNQKILEQGFYLEYTGPWPAYNFTSY